MNILVVGAGALGGYFGGRLLQAGQQVTFLVQPQRAAQLAAEGLSIRSPTGDFHVAAPPTLPAHRLQPVYDLVIVACKAYDLEGAIPAFAPAVGPDTAIHRRVLGGLAVISARLDADWRRERRMMRAVSRPTPDARFQRGLTQAAA